MKTYDATKARYILTDKEGKEHDLTVSDQTTLSIEREEEEPKRAVRCICMNYLYFILDNESKHLFHLLDLVRSQEDVGEIKISFEDNPYYYISHNQNPGVKWVIDIEEVNHLVTVFVIYPEGQELREWEA